MTTEVKINLPRSISLQVTEVCNLRCKMCYVWGETGCYSTDESGRKPIIMDIELIKRIVKELAPVKPFYSLFGGEPLTHPNLEDIITTIKQAGSFMDTPTNGTLLSKNAVMLVQTGIDSVRVSIDGTKAANDSQRGKGSYDKAMEGIESLHQEKQKTGARAPSIGIIYTVTPRNFHSIEEFFLKDLNLSAINNVSIQMENFLTEEMAESYSEMIKTKFGMKKFGYCKGFIRSLSEFNDVDTVELSRQVKNVRKSLGKLGKSTLLLPPTFSPENLSAYLEAKWNSMKDIYNSCIVPWAAMDVTASGDVAPCHVFYDLVLGNLYEHSIKEIWNGEKYKEFRKYMEENNLMSICNGGCCILYIVGKKDKKRKK